MKSGVIRLLLGDLRRNARHFAFASIGVIVGIAAFTFFLGLGAGVRQVVLGEIFPLDELELKPRTVDILSLGPLSFAAGKDVLDDAAIEAVGKIENVSGVYPKMKLTVPSTGSGGESLLGNALYTELIVDGIEPALVTGDIAQGYTFDDFDVAPDSPKPESIRSSCRGDSDCDKSSYCAESGEPTPGQCVRFIPVLASNHLVEMYNGVIRRAHGLPKLNPKFVLGLKLKLSIGDSMVRASKKGTIVKHRGQLVGFSDKAIPLGITMPIGYVKRFNSVYGGPSAASSYHSAVLTIDGKENVAEVAKQVTDLKFEVTDRGAEQAALLIAVVTAVFALVSVGIVMIAAASIMHVFFMLIFQRRKEIGVLRAVGATKADIQVFFLGQAVVVGLLAGLVGVSLAVACGAGIDSVSVHYIPDFPYKPQTYFEFGPKLLMSSLGFAVVFCVAGAFLPARRAAAMDPAPVLTGNS